MSVSRLKPFVPNVVKYVVNKSAFYMKRVFCLSTSRFRTLPNCIIVGTQKAGTTSLYGYLKQHPSVLTSMKKEVHYFDLNYHKGERWYRSFFPLDRTTNKGCVTLEASPFYLMHPHAAKRIHHLLPRAKIIVILRNPVDRAISHYYHEVKYKRETLSINEAMQAEKERTGIEWQKIVDDESCREFKSFESLYFLYTRRGIYKEQLERYFQLFKREQVLILDFDNMCTHPDDTLKKTFEFLGLDPTAASIDCSPKNVNPMRKHVPSDVRQDLENFFSPYNEKLYKYLGRKFNW